MSTRRRRSLFRQHYRAIVCAGAAVAAFAGALASAGSVVSDGLFFDLAVAKRSLFADTRGVDAASPVAVVAVDQRSIEAEELKALPRALFAPHWATLLDGVMAAGAKAVAFDIIFVWSGNALESNIDRPFIAALGRHGKQVVLARSSRMTPALPFYFAVGAGTDAGALGIVEMAPDGDGVVRRLPAAIAVEEGSFPSLAAAALARAGAPAMPPSVLVAPRRHLESLPTYSMVDVMRCAGRDPQALAKALGGRIVLVGTTLAEEDRRIGPDRFLEPLRGTGPDPKDAGGCDLRHRGASDPLSRTVPAVYLHAAAVAAVAGGTLTATVPPAAIAFASGALAAGGAWVGLSLGPWLAFAAVVAALLGLFVIDTTLLGFDLWLPITLPGIALIGAVVIAYYVRYLVEDRRRRRVQEAFSHYLAPALVERLSEDDEDLRLGGEMREISVMFADLSGFTALSDRVAPEVLTAVTNRYLGYIVESVDATGGYVEKFLGDAVMALWGAPLADPDHALHAVHAAREAIARVMAAHAEATLRGEAGFAVKVGINSGPAVVGNVGAGKRFNYSAMGITVNLAARLESVPEDYGCRLVVGPATAHDVRQGYLLCELDWIKVKGKEKAVAIFEPIVEAAKATEGQRRYAAVFAQALLAYRAGRFVEARDLWRTLDYGVVGQGKEGGPPAAMARRADAYIATPPEPPWDGVWVRRSK